MEEARDEEIEMQDLSAEEGEGAEEGKKTGGQEEEEEEAGAENEQDVTEKTPAVATRPKSHSFSEWNLVILNWSSRSVRLTKTNALAHCSKIYFQV